MDSAVIVFPGSTCDVDCYRAIETTIGGAVRYVPHTETDLSGFDLIVLPGGFSYGDYLRAGAIARFAPVMGGLIRAAAEGALVLGICNGFQILLEAGLLEGAMRRNDSLAFRCHQASLRVESCAIPFTSGYDAGETIQMPIAHGEGNYFCDRGTLNRLRANGQIVFTYAGRNPNGSVANVAGICNPEGNVLGMMPHPERAVDPRLGSEDGARLFTSVLDTWKDRHDAVVSR